LRSTPETSRRLRSQIRESPDSPGRFIEHFAAELLGITLRHGHGSFDGRRDQKSSKPTPL
ncbi:hypothetical protein J8J27_14920, partial [Mycobacterium tuberculosis]|nr:hypothetical protein [Mycobacterium tuberculosis]